MTNPPDPPDGYGQPETYDEADSWILLKKILLGVILGLWAAWIAGFASLTDATIHSFSSPVDGGVVAVLVFLTGFVFIPVHEYLHALANRRYGYGAQITWELPNPNVTVREEFVQRSHTIVALLAPLVVISPIAFIGSQLTSDPLIALFFGSAFILNTAGSCGDLYNSWYLYRRPQGTYLYMPSEGIETYIYRPR